MVITGYRLVPWLLKHLHCNQSSFDIGVCIRFNLGNVIGSADNCTFEISWDSVLLGGKMLTKLSPVSHILTTLEHMATHTFIFFMSDVSNHTFLGNVPSVFFSHSSCWKRSPVWKLPSCYTPACYKPWGRRETALMASTNFVSSPHKWVTDQSGL